MAYTYRFYVGLNTDKDGHVAPDIVAARLRAAEAHLLHAEYALSGFTVLPAQGAWLDPHGGVTREESLVYEVVSEVRQPARRIADALKSVFNQHVVLYTMSKADEFDVV